MIDVDSGHQGNIGIDRIDSIKTPAKANFQNNHIERGVVKNLQRSHGAKLEQTE